MRVKARAFSLDDIITTVGTNSGMRIKNLGFNTHDILYKILQQDKVRPMEVTKFEKSEMLDFVNKTRMKVWYELMRSYVSLGFNLISPTHAPGNYEVAIPFDDPSSASKICRLQCEVYVDVKQDPNIMTDDPSQYQLTPTAGCDMTANLPYILIPMLAHSRIIAAFTWIAYIVNSSLLFLLVNDSRDDIFLRLETTNRKNFDYNSFITELNYMNGNSFMKRFELDEIV